MDQIRDYSEPFPASFVTHVAVIASDGAGSRFQRLGGSDDFPDHRNGMSAFPRHGHGGTGAQKIYQGLEKHLPSMSFIVGFG